MIGLVGRAQTGKDTAAFLFSNTHHPCKLSKPVKDDLKLLYGWDDYVIEERKDIVDPKYGFTPRDAMIRHTQMLQRFFGNYFFIDKLLSTNKGPIIITDVRYQHDIDEIHNRNGVTIKLVREGALVKHEHEDYIDDLVTTFEVRNDGTVLELFNQLAKLKLAAGPACDDRV